MPPPGTNQSAMTNLSAGRVRLAVTARSASRVGRSPHPPRQRGARLVSFASGSAPVASSRGFGRGVDRAPGASSSSRGMFFTHPLLARAAKRVGFLKLTTKRAKKGYYKGKGAISTGRFTKAGASRATRPDFPTHGVTLTDRTRPRSRLTNPPFLPPRTRELHRPREESAQLHHAQGGPHVLPPETVRRHHRPQTARARGETPARRRVHHPRAVRRETHAAMRRGVEPARIRTVRSAPRGARVVTLSTRRRPSRKNDRIG